MAANGTHLISPSAATRSVSSPTTHGNGTFAISADTFPPFGRPDFINSHPQGNNYPPSQNGASPNWNPAALLQPHRRTQSGFQPSRSGNPSAPTSPFLGPREVLPARASTPLVFQFDSRHGSPSAGPSSQASTPSSDTPGANGQGQWIERMNNVQSRPDVPQPKRRKTEDGQDFQFRTNVPVRSSSGVFGDYVRDMQYKARISAAPTALSMTVDLTEGEDPFPLPGQIFRSRSRTNTALPRAGNDDEATVVEDPRDEEVCYGMVQTSLNCSKVPSPKPGTKSIFGEGFNPAIKIVLKRQVGDKTQKIQAYDHTRDIIGLVDASSAAALSPLLDSNIRMRTDCRIQQRKKEPGEEPGQPTSRSYPLDVVVYGRIRYSKSVGNWLGKHKLRLIAPYLVQKGIRVHNPHVVEYRPPPPKVYNPEMNGSSVSSSTRTVEEMRSEVMGVFDSLTRSEDLPLRDPDPIITTPLLKHQKQGLSFMMRREETRTNEPGDNAMVSFWQTKIAPNYEKRYYNVITQQTQREPPPETRGGILADMMGLGKTLSILSLIASSSASATHWESLPPQQPTAPETKPSRQDVLSSQASLQLTPLLRNAKTTLLICPLSTVTNWEEQIKQHVLPDSLSYHIYHGSNRIKDPERLASFDLVITTYGSVSNELSARNKGKEGIYPLEQIGWFRIVLDEAHMIREQATLQFKSIVRLQADRRWAVTGTPVQNRLEDLASLLAFLRLYPFDHRGRFTRYIVEPFKALDPEVVPRLRILVDTVTLRRLKDKINLPPRKDLVVRLEFSPEERAIYDLFAKNAQDRVKVLSGSHDGHVLGGNTYIHILKAILRLRLLCAHGKDLLNEEDLKSLQGMSADMAIDIDDDNDEKPALSDAKAHEMFALMQETNNDACIDCSKKLGTMDAANLDSDGQEDVLGYMTPCFHVICRACIRNYRDRAKSLLDASQQAGLCPVCRSHVKFEFVQLHRRDVDAEHDGPAKSQAKGTKKKLDNYSGPHTKTKALIEDLLKSKAESEANPQEPPFKSVVFSAWTSHLDLIEISLRSVGITFTRLDGTMSRTARTAAMDSFRDDNNVHVILVSIMAGGLGLNLTSGNNVYVMEPQYNPAAEAQAIDRVHRLGQKRPVRTVRYIIQDSFEEKMLELQDKKKRLASLSMDGQSKTLDKREAAMQKLKDIRSLFK
ncbi:unnamed protein product [Clonostachys rhizophaga]|uniref:Uncharacterized protein n=1 Tax=Clonostachys rhizophaga TaxID=160324 RepID=A0A9N9YA24_9HYPO|nr:unnamed protein product [Clonostachys rhizophaga]